MEKKKILIVEDNVSLLKTLSNFLTESGFEVYSVANGEDGIQMAIQEVPDLILLNILLPSKDGYQVIVQLKEQVKTKNIPIVMLTDLDSFQDIKKALDLGAHNYIIKSDSRLEEIVEKINKIL